MVNLKRPPHGAKNKTVLVQQPSFFSWEEEDSFNARASLEVFGGGPQTSSLPFSRTRSAWKDALHGAESHLPGTNTDWEDHNINKVVASVSDTNTRSAQEQVTVSYTDYSNVTSTASPLARGGLEDDVSKWLANAETSGGLVKTSVSSVSRSSDYGIVSNDFNLEAGAPRLSGCSVGPAKTSSEHDWDEVLQLRRGKTVPGEITDEAMSARAAQWGYGVVLKTDSRASGSAGTERNSRLSWTTTGSSTRSSGAGTTSDGSSVSSGFSSMIPGVSKNVKEALASFQLAFVVCDALNPEYPLLYASAGFFQMTGYTAKEVVGRNCRFLQGEYTDANDIIKIREALREGKVYTGKLLNYRKDGTPFWNMLTLSPIKDDEGRLIKYIGMQAEVTEGLPSKKDVGKNALPSDVKKFLEAEGNKGTNRKPAGSSVVSAPSTPCKSSLDTSDAQRTTHPRYSLASSRQSLELSSGTASTQDYHAAAANLKAEVAALRAGALSNGRPVETPESSKVAVEIESGCRTSRKSSKRTSGLIKLFKKLNGRFSLSKRGQRNSDEIDPATVDVVDDYYISDREDEEDVEFAERHLPRSSMCSRSSTAADDYSEVGARRSSRSSRVEERRECSSTSSNPEKTDYNGESHTRKPRSSGSYSSPGSGVTELPRPVISYGRRSAQYPAAQASPGIEGLASDRKDRRHSLATLPSAAGSSIKLEGKAQFCIVHPTVPE